MILTGLMLIVKQKRNRVDAVNADVGQCPSAGRPTILEPAAELGTAADDDGVRPNPRHLAKLTRVDQRSQPLHLRMKPPDVGDHQFSLGRFGGRDHALCFFDGDRHRFLAQNVLAGLQHLPRDGRVQVIGNGDDDRVDLGIGRQAIEIGESFFDAMLVRQSLQGGLVPVADGDDLGAGVGQQNGKVKVANDGPRSEDAHPHAAHAPAP